MKRIVFVLAAGLVLCGLVGELAAKEKKEKKKEKEAKTEQTAAPAVADKDLVECTVTGILVKSEARKKVEYSVTDTRGDVIAVIADPKKSAVDINAYVDKKVTVVGMALPTKSSRGASTLCSIKTIEKAQ